MNIQVFYGNGRVDEFDTDRFTVPQPFDGNNMLTNFEVRFDALDEESLWLQAHFYDIRSEYKQGTPADTTPVARRMRGWRFLIVDKTEIDHVAKIVIDGETVAWRQGDDLINGVRFRAQELACFSDDATSSINRKAVVLHDYLANADPVLAADEDALCQSFGFTRRAYERVLEAEGCQPIEEARMDESDDAGWLNEVPAFDEAGDDSSCNGEDRR